MLKENYGKSNALNVGFSHSKGEIIITMDADLQDDPKEVANLISKINEGWDLVSGWKAKRNDPISKTLPSKIFNKVASLMSGLKIHDFNCGLKAYKSKVVKTLNIYGGLHRFIPYLAVANGFSVTEIAVNHRAREFGSSKYGGARMIKGFFDFLSVAFITKYAKRPLHIFGSIGSIIFLLGLSINIYFTVMWFGNGIGPENRPLFFLGILLLIVGIQIFSMGFIGELIVSFLANKNESVEKIVHSKD